MKESSERMAVFLLVPRKVVVVVIVLVLLVLLAVLAAPYIPDMRDFNQTFYPAVRYTLAGENPYTAHYESTDPETPPAFFSPAWLLLILLPFGFFPLALARALWAIFLIGVTFAGVALLKEWGLKGMWPLALVALPWSLVGILFGQVTAVVFLGAVLGIIEAAKPGRSHKSALIILLGLALAGVKPQLGVFIALPLLLAMWRQRDKRLVTVLAGGALILGLTFSVTPRWLVARAAEIQEVTAPLWKSTLERELILWQLPAWIAWVMRVVIVAVMSVWGWRDRGLTLPWWSAWLAAVLVITPYTRAYDGVLMLPVLGQLIFQHRVKAFLFLAVVLLYAWLAFGEWGSVVTPLAAWLLFVPWRSLSPGFLRQLPPSTLS